LEGPGRAKIRHECLTIRPAKRTLNDTLRQTPVFRGRSITAGAQINGHRSLGRLRKITQNAGRRYVIGESDGHQLSALLIGLAAEAASPLSSPHVPMGHIF